MKITETIFFSLLIQVFSWHFVFAQGDPSPKIEELQTLADDYFYEENYKSALPICLQLYSSLPQDPIVNLYLGVCYLNLAPSREEHISKEKAITHLEFAYRTLNVMDVSYFLARAYHLTYRFEKAIGLYKNYIDSIEHSSPVFLTPFLKSKDEIARIERQIEMCENGIRLVKDTVPVLFENMGVAVNTPHPEYSPAISADNEVLVFTSRRPSGKNKRTDENFMYYEDIYITYKKEGKWVTAVPISDNINTKRHDASIGLSSDAQSLFIYYSGDIYLSSLEGEVWSKPKKLPPPVNTPYWETHISMTSSQNTVYFVSDRPGGYGGRDIYVARKLANKQYGEAKNLGPAINTPYDEEAPFIHPDEKHLYFSSTGHNSMGGFDIFYASLNNGVWSEPENLGFPINTPDDDVFFTVSSNGKNGYIATVRNDAFGDKDIYVANMPDTGEVPLTVVRGIIRGNDAKPMAAKFMVTDKNTNELIGIYKANSATGKYLLVFPPGKEYNLVIQSEGYVPHKEEIAIPEQNRFYDLFQELQLASVKQTDKKTGKDTVIGQRIFIRNAFFDIDSAIAIVEPVLKNAEIKEIAYSAFMSDYEKSPQKQEILARLDSVEGVGKILEKYKPEDEVFLGSQDEPAKLEMMVMGFDTVFTASAKALSSVAGLDTTALLLPPIHFTSHTEADTAKFRPEVYLAMKGMEKVFEELPSPSAAIGSPKAAPDTLTAQKEYLSLFDLSKKISDLEKKPVADTTPPQKPAEASPLPSQAAAAMTGTGLPPSQGGEQLLVKNEKEQEHEPLVKLEPKPSVPEEKKGDDLVGKSVILNNVLFDLNRATLKKESYPGLEKVAELLEQHPSVTLLVAGFTDSLGSESHNMILSEQRAFSVLSWLKKNKISAARLKYRGYGESNPIAPNATAGGRALNRRVELTVTGFEPGGFVADTSMADKKISVGKSIAAAGTSAGHLPAIKILSAAVCKNVASLAPVDTNHIFPASSGRIFCFTETGMEAGMQSMVIHQWRFGDKPVFEISLPVRGPKWRTYSNKAIPPSWKGKWHVDILSEENILLQSLPFTVE